MKKVNGSRDTKVVIGNEMKILKPQFNLEPPHQEKHGRQVIMRDTKCLLD